MTKREALIKEIEEASDFVVEILADWMKRSKEDPELELVSLLSEEILLDEWLTPEEDEAWKDL